MRIKMKIRQFSYKKSQIESSIRYAHLGSIEPKEKKVNCGFVEVGSNWYAYIIVDRKQLFLRFYKYYQLGIEPLLSNSFQTPTEPKMVQIGKPYHQQEKEDMLKLLTKYKDVIAWSYEELKTYDPKIITHDIPLKPYDKPF